MVKHLLKLAEAPMISSGVTWLSVFLSWVRNPRLLVEPGQIIAAGMVLAIYGKPLNWPLIVLAIFIAFFSKIRLLLDGLSTLISKSAAIEIVIAGQKIKLDSAAASDLLQKMADDIKSMINGLTDDQQLLFLFLANDARAQGKIGELPLRFERKDPPTILHRDLRALRQRHLLRPRGGGVWRENKCPEPTPFGKLVLATPSFIGRSIDPQRLEAYLARARSQG